MNSTELVHDEPVDAEPAPHIPPERRRFLFKLSLGLTGLAGMLIGLPVIGFLLAPARRAVPDVWRSIGPVGDFAIGKTVMATYIDPEPLPWAGFSADSAVWIRRIEDGTFVAFSMYCTHTGCPVAWTESTSLFFCPCHGGAFHQDGSVAAGPPPRALDRHQTRVLNGEVEVLTRRVPLPPRGA